MSAEEDLRTSEEEKPDGILREAQEAAQRWRRAWAVTLAGESIGSGVQLVLPQDHEDRWGSALGVVPPIVLPPSVRSCGAMPDLNAKRATGLLTPA
ncbi:MAG: hypothetical protein AAF355_11810 [Myxococcota bacterium]